MPDITREEDNTAVADAITDYVRCFTADPGTALHASIASLPELIDRQRRCYETITGADM